MVTPTATTYSKRNRTTDMVAPNSFHLNSHTLGSHPQTQTLEPRCTA